LRILHDIGKVHGDICLQNIMKKVFALLLMTSVLTACGTREAAPFDSFAQCLTDKEVVMYGADTCPHCQTQKKSFKGSFDLVNFVECNSSPKECQDAGIKAYPTWIIDGEASEGRLSLSEIAEKSGCELAPGTEEEEVTE
jgi:glutaredoxin